MMKPKMILPIAIGIASVVAVTTNTAAAVSVLLALSALYVFESVQGVKANEREIDRLASRIASLESSSVTRDQIKEIREFMAGVKLSGRR